MTDKIQTVAAALKKLFSSYPQFQPSDEAMAAYFEAVEDYGPQDVGVAVKRFMAGRVEDFNPSFAPPAPLVGAVVRNVYLDRCKMEATARKAALPPPPPAPVLTAEEMDRRMEFIAEMSRKYPQFGIGVEFTAGDDKETRDD